MGEPGADKETLWAPYEHPSGDFALGCPAEWELISEQDEGVLVVLAEPLPADGGFRTNLTVVAQPLRDRQDPESVLETHIAGLEEFLTDLDVLDIYELEIDGRASRRVVATFRQGKTNLALDQWLMIVDEQLLWSRPPPRPPATPRPTSPMCWWR